MKPSQNKPGEYAGRPIRLMSFRFIISVVVIAAFAYFVFVHLISLEESVTVLKRLAPTFVFLGLLAQMVRYAGNALIVRDTLYFLNERVSLLTAFLFFISSSSIGIVAGGTVATAGAMYYFARKKRISKRAAVAAGLVPDIADFVGLTILSGVAVAYLLLAENLTDHLLYIFGIAFGVVMLLVAVIGWLVLHPQSFQTAVSFIFQKISSWLPGEVTKETFEEHLGIFISTNKSLAAKWWVISRGEVIKIGGDITTLFCIFLAAGIMPSLGLVLVGYSIPLLAGKVIPGGIGIVEGLMVGVFVLLGIEAAPALVVVVAYRLLALWLPLGVGMAAFAYLQKN